MKNSSENSQIKGRRVMLFVFSLLTFIIFLASYFYYRYSRYNSNLGLKSFRQSGFPELCFNISLKRYFLNPFVAHLIPVFVVILILFFILMVQRKKDPDGLFGFNSLNAVLGCSALFFVVIFNQLPFATPLTPTESPIWNIFTSSLTWPFYTCRPTLFWWRVLPITTTNDPRGCSSPRYLECSIF